MRDHVSRKRVAILRVAHEGGVWRVCIGGRRLVENRPVRHNSVAHTHSRRFEARSVSGMWARRCRLCGSGSGSGSSGDFGDNISAVSRRSAHAVNQLLVGMARRHV